MNICVIGLGSMGKRRIRLIKQIEPETQIFGVDSNPLSCNEVSASLNIKCYSSIDECINENKIDVGFICTSPLSHRNILLSLIQNKISVFSEINLDNSYYNEVITLAKENGVKLFLSSTFLYRNEISIITEMVKEYSKPVNYTYHSGQYLLDWHPWQKKEEYFVFDKRTNGCREILAIELPWIINCFGKINKVKVIRQKISDLEVDFEDTYAITVSHENGTVGTLMVDVISRPAIRQLNIASKDLAIKWEGKPETLVRHQNDSWQPIKAYDNYDHQSGYAGNIVEDAYLAEIKDFFSYLNNGTNPKYSYEKDMKVISLINEIEESK